MKSFLIAFAMAGFAACLAACNEGKPAKAATSMPTVELADHTIEIYASVGQEEFLAAPTSGSPDSPVAYLHGFATGTPPVIARNSVPLGARGALVMAGGWFEAQGVGIGERLEIGDEASQLFEWSSALQQF